MAASEDAVNQAWWMYGGSLVFLMQAGFAVLESGCVRAKNTQSILFKNLLDASFGALGWYMFGFGFAFGEDSNRKEALSENGIDGYDGFLGTNGFFSRDEYLDLHSSTGLVWGDWFFQFTFCATAATIVSGALAERCKLLGFAIVSMWLTSFVYPVVVHWTWGGGWLKMEGYTDLAGSGIVHMVGGFAALTGAIVLGPRIGRFDGTLPASEFVPSSYSQITLGTFLLWFGWFGFNGCSNAVAGFSGGDYPNHLLAGRAMANTTIAAATGFTTCFLLQTFSGNKKYNIGTICNSILGGLVGITAGCDSVKAYAAVIIGMISCFIVIGASKMLAKFKIDDVIDAFPVHGCCGAWGVFATGLFHIHTGWISGDKNKFTRSEGKGCLGPNIYGILAIATWTVCTTLPFFVVLKQVGLLRASREEEEAGMDLHYFSNLAQDQEAIISNSGSPRYSKEIEMPAADIEKPVPAADAADAA